MFSHHRRLTLRETDSTGVIYFSELPSIAMEAFEAFLASHGFTIHQLIEDSPYLLPVVHLEADYAAPMRVGTPLDIQLTLDAVGTNSFTLATHIFHRETKQLLGKAKIVHVILSRETGKSAPIPDFIQALLEKI